LAEIAKAKEEEDKARQFSEDRARAIKEAQEKAMAEVTGVPLGSAAGPARGGGPTRGGGRGVGIRGGRGGPANVNTNSHQRRVSNDLKSQKSPISPPVEDGFEGTVARGPKNTPRESTAPIEKKKDNPARTGFSFAAAAAAAGGLLDEGEAEAEGEEEDEEEEEEKANGGVGVSGVNRVDVVTEKLGVVEA